MGRRTVLITSAVLAATLAVGVVLTSHANAYAYSVQPGDTLWAISQRTGASVADIIRANRLSNPDLIQPGQNLVIPGTATSAGTTYTVRAGDSLWSIASQLGVSVSDLVTINGRSNPDLIIPGERLQVPGTAVPVPGPTSPVSRADARAILVQAAHDQGLNPSFVLAVSYWESGFNQSMVSGDGAIGMMQVLPVTADWAGPSLLGRRVDLNNAHDNAEVGAALLRRYLDLFNDPKLALAAYYQGARSVSEHGIYPSSESYVNGIWALRNRFDAGEL